MSAKDETIAAEGLGNFFQKIRQKDSATAGKIFVADVMKN